MGAFEVDLGEGLVFIRSDLEPNLDLDLDTDLDLNPDPFLFRSETLRGGDFVLIVPCI